MKFITVNEVIHVGNIVNEFKTEINIDLIMVIRDIAGSGLKNNQNIHSQISLAKENCQTSHLVTETVEEIKKKIKDQEDQV